MLAAAVLLFAAGCSSEKTPGSDPAKCLAGERRDPASQKCVASGCLADYQCSDGNPCNGGEECVDYACRPASGAIIPNCDDAVECTRDNCNNQAGKCVHFEDNSVCKEWEWCSADTGCTPIACAVDGDCDDGLYCDGYERCVAGVCQAAEDVECDDHIDCTGDSCDESTDGCQYTPEHWRCLGDKVCLPGEGGCVIKPCSLDWECDDEIYCNGEEKCQAEKCVGTTAADARVCDDGVDCTLDICREQTDKCDNLPDDRKCDDGLYCNGPETCDTNADCRPGIPPNCDDGLICTLDSCNEDANQCQVIPDSSLCQPWQHCDAAADCVDNTRCDSNTDCPPGTHCSSGFCLGMADGMPTGDGDDGGAETDDGMGDPGYDAGQDDGGYDAGQDDGGYDAGQDDGGYDAGQDDGGYDAGQEDGGYDAGQDGGDDHYCSDGARRDCIVEGQNGECSRGTQICTNSQWGSCEPLFTASNEVCDSKDNDCDSYTDENADRSDTVCGCMTVCENDNNCPSGETCLADPAVGDFCVLHCQGDGQTNECSPNQFGQARVCVASALPVGSFCACMPNCPQPCHNDQECFSYGLTTCGTGQNCTADCSEDKQCPYPYICDVDKCHCGNLPDDCLTCSEPDDCPLPESGDFAECLNNRCDYDCDNASDCPLAGQTYCNISKKCACVPEIHCLWCETFYEICDLFDMLCTSFTDPLGFQLPIEICSANCSQDNECPLGWLCWKQNSDDSVGWCIERGCLCTETTCNPPFTDVCGPLGLECLKDQNEQNFCSRYCDQNVDCPPGFFCDSQTAGGQSLCRCGK
ncbi:MAG TPA: hypothetical protein VM425_02520 [Myxococcota bacterium]|nr:hypothetical protein [Myxococcota bacterium]